LACVAESNGGACREFSERLNNYNFKHMDKKGFVIPLVIIIAILAVGGSLYFYSKTKSVYMTNSVQDLVTPSSVIGDQDLVELNHSSRGYVWNIMHPRRYKYLTNINADGPFIEMGIDNNSACKISVTAPAREKNEIEKSGLDNVYNNFLEYQQKALTSLGDTKMFNIEKSKKVSYGNLTGFMFEYSSEGAESRRASSHNISFIAKYTDKNMIVAFVLECVPVPADVNSFLQYKSELIGIINSFH